MSARHSVAQGTGAQAKAANAELAARLQPTYWRVVAGPPGHATHELSMEDPERLARLRGQERSR